MGYSFTKRARAPLSRHPAFVPLVTVWLAALMGGIIAVLPSGHFATGAEPADFAMSQLTVAGMAALFGAGLGWVSAELFSSAQNGLAQKQVAKDTVAKANEPEIVPTIESQVVPETEAIVGPETAGAIEDRTGEIGCIAGETLVEIPAQDVPQDDPHYADIVLSELLGAPRAEANDVELTAEETGDYEPVAVPAREQEPAAEPIEAPYLEPTLEEASGPEPNPQIPQHGKAVNLLRSHDTRELAMPQLIERLAVALDDMRQMSQQAAHSYSAPAPPKDMTQRLRDLIEARRNAA